MFVAFDLDEPPLTTVVGGGALFEKLLGRTSLPAADSDIERAGAGDDARFYRSVRPIARALDQFAGVQLVPFWLVAVLVVVYIVCIGPLDYFFVKKSLDAWKPPGSRFAIDGARVQRRAPTALAYRAEGSETAASTRSTWSTSTRHRGLVRGTTWATFVQPANRNLRSGRCGRRLQPMTRRRRECCSRGWALPGSGFGGMDSARRDVAVFTEHVSTSRRGSIAIETRADRDLVEQIARRHAGRREAYAGIEGRN